MKYRDVDLRFNLNPQGRETRSWTLPGVIGVVESVMSVDDVRLSGSKDYEVHVSGRSVIEPKKIAEGLQSVPMFSVLVSLTISQERTEDPPTIPEKVRDLLQLYQALTLENYGDCMTNGRRDEAESLRETMDRLEEVLGS